MKIMRTFLYINWRILDFFPSMLTTSYAGKQSNEAYHRLKRITPLKYSPITRKLLDYEIKHDA